MEFDGIVVCKHRYGNKMTYTEQTDGDHTYEYKGLRNAISRKSTIRWYDNMIRGGG